MKANKLLKFKRGMMAVGVAGLFAGAVACNQPAQQSETEGTEGTETMQDDSEYGEVPPAEEDTTSMDQQLPAEEDTL